MTALVPRSAASKLALYLTLALLPLGLIAVWQTRAVMEDSRVRAELMLTALTQRAAQQERQVIERSLGAAAVLSLVALDLRGDPDRCSAAFRQFVASTPQHSFAGYLPVEGRMTCSSADRPFDFSGFPDFAASMSAPQARVRLNPSAPLSEGAVIVVSAPVFDGNGFAGYVSISTPRNDLSVEVGPLQPPGPFGFVMFNAAGDLLGANTDFDTARLELPRELSLADLAGQDDGLFHAVAEDGRRHVYAKAAIVPGVAYALGNWRRTDLSLTTWREALPAYALPLGMWLVSLAVAWLAAHRVVIRNVRSLQSDMRGFALHRRLPEPRDSATLPSEFSDMHRTFLRTASLVLRDETALEQALHEQRVLLKEVHHRVKNNLQLVSSIMSMQMRESRTPESRLVLQRLQDRVQGLATIHRNLYRSETLARVSADRMIADLVEQLSASAAPPPDAPAIAMDLDRVDLYPDQILPLSLLVSEAVINALKYLGPGGDGAARLDIALKRQGDGTVALRVRNTLGNRIGSAPEAGAGDGLGERLMRAFALQVGGEFELGAGEDAFLVTLRFMPTGFVETGTGEAQGNRPAEGGVRQP